MVMRHHEEQRQKEERAKREEQAKLRRVAAAIAKEVKQFWSNVEKVRGHQLPLRGYQVATGWLPTFGGPPGCSSLPGGHPQPGRPLGLGGTSPKTLGLPTSSRWPPSSGHPGVLGVVSPSPFWVRVATTHPLEHPLGYQTVSVATTCFW